MYGLLFQLYVIHRMFTKTTKVDIETSSQYYPNVTGIYEVEEENFFDRYPGATVFMFTVLIIVAVVIWTYIFQYD